MIKNYFKTALRTLAKNRSYFDLTVEENAERLDAIYNPKQELPEK